MTGRDPNAYSSEIATLRYYRVRIENTGDVAVYTGNANVSTESGQRLDPGESATLIVPPACSIYAVAEDGEATIRWHLLGTAP